jgi:hypothetical protein
MIDSISIQRQIFKEPAETTKSEILLIGLGYMFKALVFTIIFHTFYTIYQGNDVKLGVIAIPVILTIFASLINTQLPYKINFY